MARTESTETYTKITDVGDLEVSAQFSELMKVSTDRNSLYIKAKESMVEYFTSDDCILSEREKSEMLVQLVSNMAIQMTQGALGAAVSIAKENREGVYQLTKLRADTLLVQEQTDKVAAENLILGQENLLKEAQVNKMVVDIWKTQSDLFRDNGINTKLWDISDYTMQGDHTDIGAKYEQYKQAQAGTYATYAKSYRDAGMVGYTLETTTGKVTAITDDATGSSAGLTKAQTDVAIRQEAGFDDNILQHVANSSASFMGLLLSGDQSAKAVSPIEAFTDSPLDYWADAVKAMNAKVIPV